MSSDSAHTPNSPSRTGTKSAVTRSHCMSEEGSQSLFPQPSSAGLKAPCLLGAASHYHWDSIQIQSTGEVRTSDYHNTMKYSWLLNNLEFRAPGEKLLVTLHSALCIQVSQLWIPPTADWYIFIENIQVHMDLCCSNLYRSRDRGTHSTLLE